MSYCEQGTSPFTFEFCPENGLKECAKGVGTTAHMAFRDFTALILPAVSVALIGYMESMTIAKTVAKLRAKINDGGSFKLKIDPSQVRFNPILMILIPF